MTKPPIDFSARRSETSRDALAEAHRALAPDLNDLEPLLKFAKGTKLEFDPVPEPTTTEKNALAEKLIEAWKRGETGREIVDNYEHPWLDRPERRDGFTFQIRRRAESFIADQVRELTRPSDAVINKLDELLQEAVEIMRANIDDLNARAWFVTRFNALREAWSATTFDLNPRLLPRDLEGFTNYFRNAPELSSEHRNRLAGQPVVTADPRLNRQGELANYIIDHLECDPWLPTREQVRDLRWRMKQQVESEAPVVDGGTMKFKKPR